MHAAVIVERGGGLDIRAVIIIPGILRLLVQMRIAHAAESGYGAVLSQRPGGVLRGAGHHLADIPVDVAHGFVDRAVIVEVRVIGHDAAGHTVGKLMGQDIKTLRKVVDAAGEEWQRLSVLPACSAKQSGCRPPDKSAHTKSLSNQMHGRNNVLRQQLDYIIRRREIQP